MPPKVSLDEIDSVAAITPKKKRAVSLTDIDRMAGVNQPSPEETFKAFKGAANKPSRFQRLLTGPKEAAEAIYKTGERALKPEEGAPGLDLSGPIQNVLAGAPISVAKFFAEATPEVARGLLEGPFETGTPEHPKGGRRIAQAVSPAIAGVMEKLFTDKPVTIEDVSRAVTEGLLLGGPAIAKGIKARLIKEPLPGETPKAARPETDVMAEEVNKGLESLPEEHKGIVQQTLTRDRAEIEGMDAAEASKLALRKAEERGADPVEAGAEIAGLPEAELKQRLFRDRAVEVADQALSADVIQPKKIELPPEGKGAGPIAPEEIKAPVPEKPTPEEIPAPLEAIRIGEKPKEPLPAPPVELGKTGRMITREGADYLAKRQTGQPAEPVFRESAPFLRESLRDLATIREAFEKKAKIPYVTPEGEIVPAKIVKMDVHPEELTNGLTLELPNGKRFNMEAENLLMPIEEQMRRAVEIAEADVRITEGLDPDMAAIAKRNLETIRTNMAKQAQPAEPVAPEVVDLAAIQKEIEVRRKEILNAEDTAPPGNKIFSEESYNEAIKRMGGEDIARTGLDPQMLKDWVTIGGYHIEKGVREFGAWSEKMIEQVGEQIRPYLKEIYDRSLYPTLGRVEKIFEPTKEKGILGKVKKKAVALPDELRTAVTTEFAALDRLERDVYGEVGQEPPNLPLSAKFEQVAGASGKAQADAVDFYRAVVKPTKNVHDDFNAYLFLKRAENRLLTDAEGRKVGTWTVEDAQRGLAELKAKVGDEIFARLEEVGKEFQTQANQALELQVASGRKSQQWYDDIQAKNEFYAPFDVQFWKNTEFEAPSGAGRKTATKTELTKPITGVSEKALQLGDIVMKEMENIYKARILAEKNLAMRELANLADIPTETNYIRRLKNAEEGQPAQKARPGYKEVPYFENGNEVRLEVSNAVYKAVQGLRPAEMDIIGQIAKVFKGGLQAGAITLNIPFQTVNVPLDLLNLAFVSRMGIRQKFGLPHPWEAVQFPYDYLRGFWASVTANLGHPLLASATYENFMRSGAYNSTFSKAMFPGQSDPFRSRFYDVIDRPARITSLFEEATKITGLIRGERMLKEGRVVKFPWQERLKEWDKMTPEQQEALYKEMVTEVRRYAGSPDFWRYGNLGKRLKLTVPFINPGIQGSASFLSRLAGTPGAGGRAAAQAAWMRLTAWVGMPTALLLLYNLTDEDVRKDFERIPDEDRRNYFFIPRDEFATNQKGEKVRLWWTIPKKNAIKLWANMIENGVMFLWQHDPEALANFFVNGFEDLLPVNIEGKDVRERVQSVMGSLNPALKVPAEVFGSERGTNFFTHKDIVPERIQGVESKNLPDSLKYFATTEGIYKTLGAKLNVSPLILKHVVEGLTGGATRQLSQRRLLEGEPEMLGGVFRRYAKRPFERESPEELNILKYVGEQSEKRFMAASQAEELRANLTTMTNEDALQHLLAVADTNEALVSKVLDIVEEEQRGLTRADRLLKLLFVENGERARYIADRLKEMPEEEALTYIEDLWNKRLISRKVLDQLVEMAVQPEGAR